MGLLSLQKGVNCADLMMGAMIMPWLFNLYCFSRYISQIPMIPFEYYSSLGNVCLSHASWDCLFMYFVYCKHHSDFNIFSYPWCVFWTKLAWVGSGYLHTIYWELSLQRHVSIRYKSSQGCNSFNKIYWVTVPLANITTSVPSFPLKVIFFDRCSFSNMSLRVNLLPM